MFNPVISITIVVSAVEQKIVLEYIQLLHHCVQLSLPANFIRLKKTKLLCSVVTDSKCHKIREDIATVGSHVLLTALLK